MEGPIRMAEDHGTRRGKDKPGRLSRGFVRAAGLIQPQVRVAAGRRGYALARLRALWPEVAGAELAAICAPLKLGPARGPAGGLLTLAVDGPQAPRLQLLLPLLCERVNAALGPGTVGRIQLTHAAGGFAAAPPPPDRPPRPAAALGAHAATISSIGDAELRAALETLARNVLSRSETS